MVMVLLLNFVVNGVTKTGGSLNVIELDVVDNGEATTTLKAVITNLFRFPAINPVIDAVFPEIVDDASTYPALDKDE
jgi:hypothetical protein